MWPTRSASSKAAAAAATAAVVAAAAAVVVLPSLLSSLPSSFDRMKEVGGTDGGRKRGRKE